MAPQTPVKVGDQAPHFTLPNASGNPVNLADFIGTQPVVLYFYPKDDTPGCTTESCAFRDSYEQFKDLGAEVIGISSDSPNSHQQFAQKYHLPFILLSDTENKVRSLYGVPPTLFVIPGRVTYIIDRSGIVRHIFDSQFNFNAHVEEALKVLKGL
jgi:peroxiredoxin Q/BCP